MSLSIHWLAADQGWEPNFESPGSAEIFQHSVSFFFKNYNIKNYIVYK